MAEQKVLRKLGIKHRKCLLRGEPHGRHLFYSILYKEKSRTDESVYQNRVKASRRYIFSYSDKVYRKEMLMKKEPVEPTAVTALMADFRKAAELSYGEDARECGDSTTERATDNGLSKFRAEKEGISFTTEGILRASYKRNEDSAMEALHAHLGDGIVVTGTWAEAEGERELEEEELFEGEISASVFTIGCYTVRIADCLYVDDIESGTHYTQRVLAGRDRIAGYRVSHVERTRAWAAGYSIASEIRLERGVRVVTEVSAMNQTGSGAAVDCWQNICMAALSKGSSWSEEIGYICTVKKDDTVPDG